MSAFTPTIPRRPPGGPGRLSFPQERLFLLDRIMPGLAAYNGQAENISRTTLQSVSRVISVEARHASWARSLAGKLPAPVPADVPITASAALKSIKSYLG